MKETRREKVDDFNEQLSLVMMISSSSRNMTQALLLIPDFICSFLKSLIEGRFCDRYEEGFKQIRYESMW